MYKEEHFRWYSPNLSKDMEMLVFGHTGYPVVVFPTTMGRYYEVKDFELIESAHWFLEEGLVQIFCPDSINELSFYNRNIPPAQRIQNHVWYDKMVLEEIVDKIRGNTGTGKVAVAGPSFGGYQAANFAFKHPEKVSHLFSMSGSFDIKSFMDGYYDDNVYFNNPVDFVPGLDHPDLYKMEIVLGTSEWDTLKAANEHFSGLLNEKGVSHWLDMRGWIPHDWPLWREMFPHYLSLI